MEANPNFLANINKIVAELDVLININNNIENISITPVQLAGVIEVKNNLTEILSVNAKEKSISTKYTEVLQKANTIATTLETIINLKNDIENATLTPTQIEAMQTVKDNIAALLQIDAKEKSVSSQHKEVLEKSQNVDTKNENVNNKSKNVDIKHEEVVSKHNIVLEKANEIKDLTVELLILDSTAQPSTNYNSSTGTITLRVPRGLTGPKGEPFKIDTFGLASQKSDYDNLPRYASFFEVDTQKLYFKKSDTEADWTTGIDFGKGDKGDSLTISDVIDNDDYTFTWNFSDGTSFTTPSLRGATGATGIAPEHELIGSTGIRFKNPDGSWGKSIDLSNTLLNELKIATHANFPFSGLITSNVNEQLNVEFNNSLVVPIKNKYIKIDGKIENIENMQIDFSNRVPETYVSKDGLTPNDVKKGDYVVDSRELGNSDLTKWIYGKITPTVDGEFYRATSTGESFEAVRFTETTIPKAGDEINITFTVDVSNSSDATTELVTFDNLNNYFEGSGTFSYTCIADGTTDSTSFAYRADTGYVLFSDVSITVKRDIKRATSDTSDMYNISTEKTSHPFIVNGLVVNKLVTDSNGIAGKYLADFDYGSAWNPSSENYTVGAWRYLGTASNMSLHNPFFENREYISNQVLASVKKDINGVITIDTQVMIKDFNIGMTQKGYMIANGFTEKSIGEYTKNGNIFVPLAFWQTLNKGAYEPVLNPFGSGASYSLNGTSASNWFATDRELSHASDMFLHAKTVGTASGDVDAGWYSNYANNGIPNNKYYNVVYENQLIHLWNHANEYSDLEINTLNNRNMKGIDSLESTYNVSANITESSTTSTTNIFTVGNDFVSRCNVGDEIEIISSSRNYVIKSTIVGVLLGDKIRVSSNFERIQGDVYTSIKTQKQLPVISYGTHLLTDIIGDPANYSDVMKSQLSQRKPLVGMVANLVNKNDNSSSTPPANKNILFRNKMLESQYKVVYRMSTTDDFLSATTSLASITGNYKTIGDVGAEYFQLAHYIVINKSLVQSELKQITHTDDKVIFSTDNRTGKGSRIIDSITDGIATGDTNRGLESKVLENILLDENGVLVTVPEHKTPTLDTTTSKGAKWFNSISAEDGIIYNQVIGQEIIKDNSDNYNSTIFDNISNGTTLDDVGTKVKTKILCNAISHFRKAQ